MHWIIKLYFLCSSISILGANINRFHPAVKTQNSVFSSKSVRFRVSKRNLLGIKKSSANIKASVSLEHYLIEKLQNETSVRQNLENLCKSYEEALWLATTRSLMKDFEDMYGDYSSINRKVIPSGISYHGRTRYVRKLIIIWIVENRSNETNVRELIQKVEKSIERKEFTSLEDFADAYASLYDELSRILKTRLIYPMRGPVSYEYTVLFKSANKAMPVFMSIFNFPKYSHNK